MNSSYNHNKSKHKKEFLIARNQSQNQTDNMLIIHNKDKVQQQKTTRTQEYLCQNRQAKASKVLDKDEKKNIYVIL